MSESLLCLAHAPIVVNGFNTIRVVSDGSSHSVFLNNQFVCTVNDATYVAGGVMLGAVFRDPIAGHSLAYDFLTIQSIGSNEPTTGAVAVMDPAAMAPMTAPANMFIMGSSANEGRTAGLD